MRGATAAYLYKENAPACKPRACNRLSIPVRSGILPRNMAMTERERTNARHLTLGEGAWGFLYSLVIPSTVLTVLLRRLGAGELMIGAVTAAEAGLAVLPQFLGNLIAPSGHERKRFLVLWHIALATPCFLAMGLLVFLRPVLGDAAVRWGLLASFAAIVVGLGSITSVWLDWMAHLFPRDLRGRVLGRAWGASFALSTVSALSAGAFLRAVPGLAGYGWLYLAAAALVPPTMAVFLRLDDHAVDGTDMALRLRPAELASRFRLSLRDRNFRAFLAGRMLSIAGFSVTPFLAVHFASPRGGSVPEGVIVLCGAAMTMGQMAAVLILGRLGDKRGHRACLLVVTAAQALTLLSALCLRGVPGCLVCYLGAGVCGAGGFLSTTNLLFETCPHDSRLAHITAGNLALSAVSIVAPLAGGAVSRIWGNPALFAACMTVSALSFLWCLTRLKEPRTAGYRV